MFKKAAAPATLQSLFGIETASAVFHAVSRTFTSLNFSKKYSFANFNPIFFAENDTFTAVFPKGQDRRHPAVRI